MKHLLSICMYWLCVQYNMAQTLSPVQCFDGGGAERLDKFEPISPTQSLLLLRSTSQNGIFQDNTTPDDSLTIRYGQYWLFSLNNSGDTLWKKPLPSSEKTFKREALLFPIYFESYVNSASSKMYTTLEEEIILHYDHFDSVGYDSPQLHTNNLHISFGIMHTHDGNYKTMPFVIDTLYPDRRPPIINSYQVIKRNDSIYDIAIHYSYILVQYTYHYSKNKLNFYRININDQTVQKKTLDDPYFIVNTGKQFILLSKIYGILQIHKLDESFNISESAQIAVTQIGNDIQPVISVVDNGKLILTERIKAGEIQQERIDAAIITINLDDLSYTTQSFNPYPDAYQSDNSILPVPYAGYDYSKINLEYSLVLPDIPNSTYSLLYSSARHTDTAENIYYTQLIKTDSTTGEAVWLTPIDSSIFFEYIFSSYNDFATTYNDQVFLFYNKFIETNSWYHYNSRIKKINENGQHQWTTTITDSIYIDSMLYTSSSPLDYHNTLAYGNKAVISKQYTGRRNDSSFAKYIYFLLSLEDGSTEPLILPDNQNPYIANTNYPYLVSTYSYTYKFFNNEAGELFIVYNNYNGCAENSDLDVSIEKYGQLISKLPANNIAERMNFTIFPNPARATIHVRLTNAEDFNKSYYTILDMTGRVLRQGIVIENEFQIDTQTLSEGNYLLHISQGNSTGTQKFQIIR